MRSMIWSLGAVLLLLGACGKKEEKKAGPEPSGSYARPCTPDGSDYRAHRVTFDPTSKAAIFNVTFFGEDGACATPLFTLDVVATYALIEIEKPDNDIYAIAMTYQDVIVTPVSDEVAAHLNGTRECSKTDWAAATAASLKGLTCASFAEPLSRLGATEVLSYKVEGDKVYLPNKDQVLEEYSR